MRMKKISRLNKDCAYYPCHDGLQDCTFCYCPFYPCKDSRRGIYIVTRDKKKIWSCKDCNWIHTRKVVDRIFAMIRRGQPRGTVSARKRAAGTVPCARPGTGVIILGHGSRLKEANGTIRRAADEIKAISGLSVVEPAYLQLCRPDLQTTIRKIAKRGCARIIIVPFFLFRGNHVKRDIPDVIRREAGKHTRLKLIYARNIGEDPRIHDIVMDCIQEVMG